MQYSESAEYGCISGVYLEYKNTSHRAISIFSGYLSESVFSESTEPERILLCSIFNLVPIIVLSYVRNKIIISFSISGGIRKPHK